MSRSYPEWPPLSFPAPRNRAVPYITLPAGRVGRPDPSPGIPTQMTHKDKLNLMPAHPLVHSKG